jgi:hypothetical protein
LGDSSAIQACAKGTGNSSPPIRGGVSRHAVAPSGSWICSARHASAWNGRPPRAPIRHLEHEFYGHNVDEATIEAPVLLEDAHFDEPSFTVKPFSELVLIEGMEDNLVESIFLRDLC